MIRPLQRSSPRRRGGFTLAEVAVAIVIVGMGLIWILEGLNGAKLTAAHTRNYKLARDLALVTLGQIESGEFREDISRGLVGTYEEEGYPDFAYEVILGDEAFGEKEESTTFDSWKPRTRAQLEEQQEDAERTDEEREEDKQPFEKLKIRVTFPKIREYTNDLVLERWVPWDQVYGPDEEDAAAANGTDANGAASGGAGGTGSKSGSSSSSGTQSGGGK
ncbi:MAG: prepilin-type N-terminal cleavage/methylation domain-containing protein [Planctomycetes bacterium]|nr:prepilin-type N-terminal cleavage/methylation domain-containing protein [Planctomycetota bacterium]